MEHIYIYIYIVYLYKSRFRCNFDQFLLRYLIIMKRNIAKECLYIVEHNVCDILFFFFNNFNENDKYSIFFFSSFSLSDFQYLSIEQKSLSRYIQKTVKSDSCIQYQPVLTCSTWMRERKAIGGLRDRIEKRFK